MEYSLAGGGWRPSEARVTDVLTGPTVVSLADVQNDIDAVRVTYLNAETGEERADSGFAPGQITLNIKTGVDGEAQLNVQTRFDGTLLVRTNEGRQAIARSAERSDGFTVTGSGAFAGGFCGRGRQNQRRGVYGWHAVGLWARTRLPVMRDWNVTLLNQSGEVVGSCRTGADGRYEFAPVSGRHIYRAV